MTDANSPADRYYIGGAGLPAEATKHLFPFETARKFQQRALDWIYSSDGYAPVSALAAPTGGGKTAIIAALADAAESGAICTYPTNKLVEEQAAALRAIDGYDFSVDHVTGDTISGTGDERSTNLLNRARSTATDVVVTNPDILQAVLQDSYFSPGGRVMEFYSYFDAAIFDEFHYYDPFAASGLLTQINTLSNRGAMLDEFGERRPPRVLLTSATPDESFVDHIAEDLQIEAQLIRSELVSLDIEDPEQPGATSSSGELIYQDGGVASDVLSTLENHAEGIDPNRLVKTVPEGVDRFRYPMRIDRYDEHIETAFEAIAERLANTVGDLDPNSESDPVAAIIFNSAARSNSFQSYLHEECPSLASVTQKDNGYDTHARTEADSSGLILNTTSKGEVGLDFDLRRLTVVAPWTAADFIQRVGRAARQSPAVVELYGLDDPTWPSIQSYAGFLRRVVNTLSDPGTVRERLRQLAGLRSARAIQTRMEDTTWHPDLKDDFEAMEYTGMWQSVLIALAGDDVEAALEATLGAPYLDNSGRRAIQAAQALGRGLDSLRGRSTSVPISYPIGETTEATEYDLVRALRHYSLDGQDDQGRLVLRNEPSERLIGYYPGRPFGGDGIDLQQSRNELENELTDAYTRIASAADLRELPLNATDLELLFKWVPLRSALLPTRIDTERHTVTFDTVWGEVSNIESR